MKAVRLRTEYLDRPLGLGISTPRLSWNCEGGVKQTAYQIIAKDDQGILWDSGKVASDRMHLIPWGVKPLESRQRVSCQVTLWDENDQPGETAETWFEMGLLKKSDWTAKWISAGEKPRKGQRYPVDCFRKGFSLSKPVRSARLYASARGVYALSLNDHAIEDFILAPGMTDYRKRIQYQTYDVTGFLVSGKNCLCMDLADGWYRGSCAAYGVTEVYGRETSLTAQLEIKYEDGSRDVIISDNTWDWSNDGPVRFADLKDGEINDARKVPGYQGKAREVKAPDALPVASDNVPVTEHEHFSGTELKKGVLDFGQNLAGYLSFWVKGKPGQTFRVVCGEMLDAQGNVDLNNIQETRPAKGWGQMSLIRKLMANQVKGETALTPRQEIVFTCSGQEDVYKTRFAVFGFRYAQVIADEPIALRDAQAIAVYSDLEETGTFRCSHEGINQLVSNVRWSMKSNFLDLPTDCPTRERLGWTGDAQIFFNTGAYFMDTAPFFRKWLRDMADAQYANGLLPAVLPYQGVEMMYKSTGSSVGWADAVYLIPYRYFLRYGDPQILFLCWPMMRKYAEYLLKNREKDGTFQKGVQLGEWLEPSAFRDQGPKEKHPEEGTAYFCLAMGTLAEIADVLQEKALAKTWRDAYENARKTYQQRFGGELTKTERPSKLVRPLAFDLLDEEMKKAAQRQLKLAEEKFGFRVGTGFLSTPFLLPVLTEAGETETAYRILENEQNPGWLYEVNHGATTVWETWEGTTTGENNSGSLNHYSPGAVCEFLFSTVGGIRVKEENQFEIAPLPGGTLSFAETHYNSPYGEVRVAWKKNGGKFQFAVTIPANCTAQLRLPDGRTEQLCAGLYEF